MRWLWWVAVAGLASFLGVDPAAWINAHAAIALLAGTAGILLAAHGPRSLGRLLDAIETGGGAPSVAPVARDAAHVLIGLSLLYTLAGLLGVLHTVGAWAQVPAAAAPHGLALVYAGLMAALLPDPLFDRAAASAPSVDLRSARRRWLGWLGGGGALALAFVQLAPAIALFAPAPLLAVLVLGTTGAAARAGLTPSPQGLAALLSAGRRSFVEAGCAVAAVAFLLAVQHPSEPIGWSLSLGLLGAFHGLALSTCVCLPLARWLEAAGGGGRPPRLLAHFLHEECHGERGWHETLEAEAERLRDAA
jgi:hypothetical protein